MPCTNAPTLHKSGLINNEFNAHQWQASPNPQAPRALLTPISQCGFGVVAFRTTYPQFASRRIVGCVVVACSDGAMLYRTTSEPSIESLPGISIPQAADPPPELSMFAKSSFDGGIAPLGPLTIRSHSSPSPKGGPLIDALIVKSGFTNIKKTGNLLLAKVIAPTFQIARGPDRMPGTRQHSVSFWDSAHLWTTPKGASPLCSDRSQEGPLAKRCNSFAAGAIRR